jgi:DHA2 family multidrug resistance protein
LPERDPGDGGPRGGGRAAPAGLTVEALRERHGERYKWLVLATVMIGMMASIMSTTIVNVAVPDMIGYFAIGQERAQWISTAFMVAMTLSLPLTPWLLQRYGLRRTYGGAVTMLMLGGIIGGLSGNFSVMIAMRVVEGMAAGLLQPIPNVVIMRAFGQHEQGRAMGVFGFGVVLAPAVGPTVGGLLVEAFGWRSIFFVVVPFCVVALFMIRRYLAPVSSFIGERQKLDWPGLLLLSVATLALLNGLVALHGETRSTAVGLMVLGLSCFAGFVFYQLRRTAPLLQLRLFAHRSFAAGAVVSFIYGASLFGSTYLFPVYMQMALSYTPSQAGLVLLPAGIMLAITMPLAGKLADRLPHWRLVAVGQALLGISLALMAWREVAGIYMVLVAWAVLGRIGFGLSLPALSLGSVRGLAREEIPQAASVSSFLRQLGGAIGVGAVGIGLEWRLSAHDGGAQAYGECFIALACLSLLASIAAWFMRSPGRAP